MKTTENDSMIGVCIKCGYVWEMHKIGRVFPDGFKIIIGQCPMCCFLYKMRVDKGAMI